MRGEPHEFAGNEYHCTTCGSAYHCGGCNTGSGSQGHTMKDDDGFFFSCQEPERAEKVRLKWVED